MIGDVLAVVAALVGICVSAWALMVTCGLLFPAKAESARSVLLAKPKTTIGLGLALTLLPGVLGIVMLGLPLPGVKLLGMAILLAILGCGALGGAGVSFVAGDRIQRMAPDLSDYAVFVRGAGFLVVASVFPIVGWFFFGPLALFAAVGSGARAIARGTLIVRHGAEPIA
jgi:hypothetical protein